MNKLDGLWFHNLWNNSRVFDFPRGTSSQAETDEVMKEAIRLVIPDIINYLGDKKNLIYYNNKHKEDLTEEIKINLGINENKINR